MTRANRRRSCYITGGKVHHSHKPELIAVDRAAGCLFILDGDMEGTHLHLSGTAILGLLVLSLLQGSVQALDGEPLVLSVTFM